MELDNIFVLPAYIGHGIGKKLMGDFFDRAKAGGYTTIRLYSDPNARPFYEKLGFEVVGQSESSIKNRYLPIMEKTI